MFTNMILFTLFFLLNLTNCSSYQKDNNIINVDDLNIKLMDEFKEKYFLEISGVGVRAPDGVIQKLTLMFKLKKQLSKEECRKLIIFCARGYLKAINEDEKLRPSLCCYPFKIENIEIMISFLSDSGKCVEYPYVGIVDVYKGKIIYNYADSSLKKKFFLEEEEPFPEN
jgi:hypothetical protein